MSVPAHMSRRHRIRLARCRPSRAEAAPADGPRRQIPQVDAEHVVNAQARPHGDEILQLGGKRLLVGRQVGGVDAAGRDAGEDIGREIGKHARELAENPDLVRSARTTAATTP